MITCDFLSFSAMQSFNKITILEPHKPQPGQEESQKWHPQAIAT